MSDTHICRHPNCLEQAAIASLLAELEYQSRVAAPIDDLACVAGDWRLLYSTIRITGVKRTKLGLREFVKLGEFVQRIDAEQSLAVRRAKLNAHIPAQHTCANQATGHKPTKPELCVSLSSCANLCSR